MLHNMLIDNGIPVLPELDVERPSNFNTISGDVDFSSNLAKSREVRKGIAKYLGMLPFCQLNEYPNTV